jgi:23S rRNA (cytosine1962-C5)-methyltransferase
MEKRKDMLYACLLDVLQKDGQNVDAVYERNDVKARNKEGLPLYKGFWRKKAETDLIISENGLKLHVDIENGQKTGYFLDQKRNRLIIRQLAAGLRVCDCFTHTGGFALNAALGKAAEVTAVDVSGEALREAEANAALNDLHQIRFVQADVFAYLDTVREGQFDLIILDPPAFTKNRRTVDHAYQGYLTINRGAMRILRQGGYLATCSCSRYMENALFEQMLKEAAGKEHVLLRQISVSQQNSDHPIVWTMDETSYLKFYVFQVLPQW